MYLQLPARGLRDGQQDVGLIERRGYAQVGAGRVVHAERPPDGEAQLRIRVRLHLVVARLRVSGHTLLRHLGGPEEGSNGGVPDGGVPWRGPMEGSNGGVPCGHGRFAGASHRLGGELLQARVECDALGAPQKLHHARAPKLQRVEEHAQRRHALHRELARMLGEGFAGHPEARAQAGAQGHRQRGGHHLHLERLARPAHQSILLHRRLAVQQQAGLPMQKSRQVGSSRVKSRVKSRPKSRQVASSRIKSDQVAGSISANAPR